MRRKKRTLPNPLTIKKRSDFARHYAPQVVISGEREKTEQGYVVRGYAGKHFETHYGVMLPGTCSPIYKHNAKNRVLRVLAGEGVVRVGAMSTNFVSKSVLPGDEVHFAPGTNYQITTKSNNMLEYFVTQDSKYESRLKIISPGIEVTEEDRTTVGTAMERTRTPQRTRRPEASETARRQAAALRTSRKVPSVSNAVSEMLTASTEEGVNLRPTGGRFSDEGAG